MASPKMMQLIWNLKGRMDGSVGQATKRTADALKSVNKAASSVGQRFSFLNGSIGKMGALLAGGALAGGGAGLLHMIDRVTETTDRMNKLSQQIGVTARDLSTMNFAASMSGVESEAFSGAMKKLNQKMAEAAQGSKEAQLVFRRVGVSIYDSSGKLKPATQYFMEMSDVIKKIPVPAAAANLAVSAMGKSGAELIPMINEGSKGLRALQKDAENLGLGFSDEDADAASAYGDAMARVKAANEGIANSITNTLTPVLTPLLNDLADWIAANRKLIATRFSDYIKAIITHLKEFKQQWPEIKANIEATWKKIDGVAEAMGGWGNILKYVARGIIAIKAINFSRWLLAVVKDIFFLGKALVGVIPHIVRFGAVLLANPIGLVIAGIAALVAAGYLLWKNWDKITAYISESWAEIKAAFGEGPIQGLLKVWEKFSPVKLVMKAINELIKYLTGVDLYQVGGEMIKRFYDGIMNLWKSLKGKLVETITDWLPDWAKSTVDIPDISSQSGMHEQVAYVKPYANGGLVTRPQNAVIGEAGAEMVIPLTRKTRGRELLSQAAGMLGGTAPAGIVSAPDFAPVINITGATDPVKTAEQVKNTLQDELVNFRRMFDEMLYQQSRRRAF